MGPQRQVPYERTEILGIDAIFSMRQPFFSHGFVFELGLTWLNPFQPSDASVDSDRRTTFRAELVGTREALLVARGRNLRVRIIDESSGGLCVSTNKSFPFADGTKLRLSTDDGDELSVQIVYHRKEQRRTLIGLQRTSEPVAPRHQHRGTRPLILLVGLTLGLYAGFALRVETIREYANHVPAISKLIQHH